MADTTDNARHDSASQAGSLPFFARFLEGQRGEERSAATTKFPSDLDEFVTHKYPSDGDDDNPPVEDALLAAPARPMTLKYPSDRDEIEPFLDGSTDDGNTLNAASARPMTLKYPSDRDEWDPFFEAPTEDGGTLNAAPARPMTLKYPSDRDEIDWSHGN
ncbi:MAG TPA: microviridin/marinostatin family tricyclic proteinase inhibitor [Pyrinomonadaceae bacterium]